MERGVELKHVAVKSTSESLGIKPGALKGVGVCRGNVISTRDESEPH